MKTKNYLLGMAGFFIVALLLITSCKKDPIVEDAKTRITGTAKLQAGVSGDLGNAQVAIYTSEDDWNNYNPVALADVVTGSGAKITFTFNDVVPGNYYLDVWADLDNSGDWSDGDLVGFYGSGALSSPNLSPFMVKDGKTFNHTIACGVY